MTTATERKILVKLKQYEGQTVGDFMYSDLVDFIGVDTIKINGVPVKYGDEYDPSNEGLVIRYINVYNVMGYIFADITTEAE